jgi:copper chaperone CopZ
MDIQIRLTISITTDSAVLLGSSHTGAKSVKKMRHDFSRRIATTNCVAITPNICHSQGMTARTKTAIISIENLRPEDLPKLKAAFAAVAGVDKVDFSVERSVAVLDFDPSQSHIDDFLRAVLKAGFKVL